MASAWRGRPPEQPVTQPASPPAGSQPVEAHQLQHNGLVNLLGDCPAYLRGLPGQCLASPRLARGT